MVTTARPRTVAARFRTGPLGRLVRLGWAAAAALALVSIVDARGSARFRNTHVLTEPSAWFLHALMLVVFVLLVGAIASALGDGRMARRVQVASVAAMTGIVAVAGGLGHLAYGSAWGFPLADLVWWFDVLVLAQEVVALVLAIVLGTPGCEIGVWPELIARVRGERSAPSSGLACIVGLHLLDEWEARRGKSPHTSSPR
jgi:hypothetical protein